MLGALDVVLAGLAVLLDGLELLLGLAADTAHLDAGVLGAGAGELDVVLAALLGQCRQGDTDDGAVIGGVDAEVGLADGGDDVLHGGAVEGADQDGAGLGDRQGGELLERGGGAVVVHDDPVEHRGVGAAGADGGQLALGGLEGLVHLVLGLEHDVVDHGASFTGRSWVRQVVGGHRGDGCGLEGGAGRLHRTRSQSSKGSSAACRSSQPGQSQLTSVPILSPSRARVMLPGSPMPKTRIVRPLSRHRAKAEASTTWRPSARARS